MPVLKIHIANSQLETSYEGEFASIDAALREAVKGGLEIVTHEFASGSNAEAAEVRVEDSGIVVARGVVTLSFCPLSASELS